MVVAEEPAAKKPMTHQSSNGPRCAFELDFSSPGHEVHPPAVVGEDTTFDAGRTRRDPVTHLSKCQNCCCRVSTAIPLMQ